MGGGKKSLDAASKLLAPNVSAAGIAESTSLGLNFEMFGGWETP